MCLDNYFDKIFVINLDSREDRWMEIIKQLNELGIKNFKRKSGVVITDGMLEVTPQSFYSKFKFDTIKEEILKPLYLKGALGCKQAHLDCIYEAKQNGYKRILILEDDVIINKNVKILFSDFIAKNIDWDMLYLGGDCRGKSVYQTSSYAVNSTLFDKILDKANPSGEEIDFFYVNQIQPNCRLVVVTPPMCIQSHKDTNIPTFRMSKEDVARAGFHYLANTVLNCNGPIYYFANTGNWGDAVIRYGTKKFLDSINVKYTEFSDFNILMNQQSSGATVLYGGGGGWCEFWADAARRVVSLKSKFKVIVFPSTYQLLHNLTGVKFFSRDHQSVKNNPNSSFCPDLAFFIGNEFAKNPYSGGTGNFFRTDVESLGRKLPEGNIDISSMGNHFSSVPAFFTVLNAYSVINTDRLHVAIAGSLLGKEVNLYSGKYFKNKAVYESSIEGVFEKTRFVESTTKI